MIYALQVHATPFNNNNKNAIETARRHFMVVRH